MAFINFLKSSKKFQEVYQKQKNDSSKIVVAAVAAAS